MSIGPADRFGEERPVSVLRCDALMLCDGAEAVNGKLYILGGGWDRIWATSVPVIHEVMHVALRLIIPWNDTNEDIPIVIGMENEDGEHVDPWPLAEANLQMGRPPGVVPGTDLTTIMAIAMHHLEFKTFGTYALVLSAKGTELSRTVFHVTQMR